MLLEGHSAVGCCDCNTPTQVIPRGGRGHTPQLSVSLAMLNSAVPLKVPLKSTAEGRSTLGYFSQAGHILLKFR